MTAKAVATLDHLSGGRLIAGSGARSRRHEAEAAGVRFELLRQVAEEYIQAIATLWNTRGSACAGRSVPPKYEVLQ